METSEADESRLLFLAKEGSAEALSALIRLHQGRVRSFLACHLRGWDVVDDLAQETFLAAYRNLSAWSGEGTLGQWMLGIARNKLLMHLREQARRRSHESGDLESLLASLQAARAESCDHRLEHHVGKLTALEQCIKKLPGTTAELLSTYYSGRQPSSELARQFGKTGSGLRMTILKIRKMLRDCIRLRLGESGVGA